MAQLKDSKAPTTVIRFKGKKNQDKSYRSDVTFELKAKDSPHGLGVAYSMYRLDDKDWEQYVSPVHVTSDGHHTLQFYSVDPLDNIEPTKQIEFDIHKRVPKSKFENEDQDEQEEIVPGIEIRSLITRIKGSNLFSILGSKN
jgi:hypothetical protein